MSDKLNSGIEFIAYDVLCVSRHGIQREVDEMRRFLDQAMREGLVAFVFEIFYDSKCSVCNFTFDPVLSRGDVPERALYRIAKETITQFRWFDKCIEHGSSIDEQSHGANVTEWHR